MRPYENQSLEQHLRLPQINRRQYDVIFHVSPSDTGLVDVRKRHVGQGRRRCMGRLVDDVGRYKCTRHLNSNGIKNMLILFYYFTMGIIFKQTSLFPLYRQVREHRPDQTILWLLRLGLFSHTCT